MKQKVDGKQLIVLRTITALIMVDKKADTKELEWFERIKNRYDLSPEQVEQLENDLRVPLDLETIFRQNADYTARDQVINFSRVVFNIDGEFHPDEERAFKMLVRVQDELSPDIKESFAQLGKAVKKDVKKDRFYNNLSGLSNELGGRVRIRHVMFPQFYLFRGLFSGNPLIFWFCLLLIAGLVLFRMFVAR